MQTPASKQQPSRRTLAAAAKLPYPPMPETGERLFWLSVLFRDLAELQALQMLVKELHNRRRPDVVLLALYSSMHRMREELKTTQGCVIRAGLLPFAWAGTTVFNANEGAP